MMSRWACAVEVKPKAHCFLPRYYSTSFLVPPPLHEEGMLLVSRDDLSAVCGLNGFFWKFQMI